MSSYHTVHPMKTQNLRAAFDALKKCYGSHKGVAKVLGISWRHYAGLRLGERLITESRKKHILLLAAASSVEGEEKK